MRKYLSGIVGWIKLYRSVLNNPVVMKSEHNFCVWMLLLLLACGKDRKATFNRKEIILKEGEIITSRDELAGMISGLNSSAVERALKDFENAQQIEQRKSNQGRLISLKNWNYYQSKKQHSEHQTNNGRTSDEQQMNTNKEREKDKNDKKERGGTLSFGEYENVFLSENDLQKLKEKYPDRYLAKINRLSVYLETSGKTYHNHYAKLVEWLEKDAEADLKETWKSENRYCDESQIYGEGELAVPEYLLNRKSYDVEELGRIL